MSLLSRMQGNEESGDSSPQDEKSTGLLSPRQGSTQAARLNMDGVSKSQQERLKELKKMGY